MASEYDDVRAVDPYWEEMTRDMPPEGVAAYAEALRRTVAYGNWQRYQYLMRLMAPLVNGAVWLDRRLRR